MAKTTEQVGKMEFVNLCHEMDRRFQMNVNEVFLSRCFVGFSSLLLAARSDARGTSGGVTRFGKSWGKFQGFQGGIPMLHVRRIRMNLGLP